jgi:type IX secretion system substrate protein
MKKILLSLVFLCSFAMVKAQVVLNEVYLEPGAGNSEFIELYNSGADQNMDCFTILVYWSTDTDKGWYALDLPSVVLSSQDWLVVAAASPFNVQALTGVTADVNWNSLPASGSLTKYTVSGGGYTSAAAGVVTDLMAPGDFHTGINYLIMLFQNGNYINGFWGGGPSPGTNPITTMPDLTTAGATACADLSGFDFGSIAVFEFHNPSGGSDNGYAREFDGKCGTWTKTSSGDTHTPGATNGLATGEAGSLIISQVINCTAPRTATVDVTGITGTLLSEALDFPVTIRIFLDANFDSIPDGAALFAPAVHTTIAQAATVFGPLPDANADYIVSYQTNRGCFDRQEILTNACATLPVNLKFFNATRANTNVDLVWATATEENNKGYYIQRKIGAGAWVTIAFVPSQAFGGNSFSLLRYEYTDNNPTKGITQYRLRQVDIDGKIAVSNIRAVRGMAQRSNVIIYPNPSNDGKVNVVFEDVNVVRNVSLMDMSGRMLKQWRNVTNNNIQIDNLTPGFYSVRIENTETGELVVEKIVVNKR